MNMLKAKDFYYLLVTSSKVYIGSMLENNLENWTSVNSNMICGLLISGLFIIQTV